MDGEIREYRLVHQKGEVWFPPIQELQLAPKPASRKSFGPPPVVFQCADCHMTRLVDDMSEWLDEMVCSEMYRIFGLFYWQQRKFRVDRQRRGLVLYFMDMGDAVYCRSAFSSTQDYI